MAAYNFPQDLRDAQLALHRTRTAYEGYARALPGSAEPSPGWEAEKAAALRLLVLKSGQPRLHGGAAC
ncbi:hypothetical protein [Streptomyces sp. CA-256286]|uniref:hypothetical protein n=1 Tax=Streptomyces sp. CA-256286 TaxID=2801033 RepID=UPI001F612302|nr:hypothetical protein [Streptomyces sp. CA-256286]